jgi:HD-GYP domain-containing protein (c-di-GMP phosphodiesterase class II)
MIAALAPWQRALSIPTVALVLVVWLVVERVKFPVAGGWTYPTMLAFVPALFVLPTPIVPLVAMAAALLRRSGDLVRGRAGVGLVPDLVADDWYTIGPTLVIVLGGAQQLAWVHWPVYVAALAAQLLCDAAATVSRCALGERISPRVQIPLLTWLYVVDIALAPVGLLIAAAAMRHSPLLLLALPPTGVMILFARERQQRLDATLELSTAYRGTTLLLGDLIEADDNYTGVHSRDVVDLTAAISDALELDQRQRRNLEFSALLHDVGKIRVPKEILNKRGALDDAEWEIVKRHTIEGEAMLRQVGGTLASLAPIVRASHEHWDGSGYPDGLRGEEIPIEARIIAACDAYNAMTTNRPYRSALPPAEALAELKRCAGSQFDPQIVRVLERHVRAESLPVLDAASAAARGPMTVIARPSAAGTQPGSVAGTRRLAARRQGYTAVSARL